MIVEVFRGWPSVRNANDDAHHSRHLRDASHGRLRGWARASLVLVSGLVAASIVAATSGAGLKNLIAAIVCIGALYLVDASFFSGRYFGGLFDMLSRALRRF